jgi:hypothetical protein
MQMVGLDTMRLQCVLLQEAAACAQHVVVCSLLVVRAKSRLKVGFNPSLRIRGQESVTFCQGFGRSRCSLSRQIP